MNTSLLPSIQVQSLTAGYRSRRQQTSVLSEVNLTVAPHDLVAIIGSNGAGKSTLLRTLTGVQPPLSGDVCIGGMSLRSLSAKDRAKQIAVVSTERVDVAMLRVEEVVGLGRHPHTGWTATLGSDDQQIVERCIAQVRAESLTGRFFSSLSDGEKQRVTIARALAQEPSILVLDEPTAFLDPRAKARLMALVTELINTSDLSVLLATHDLDLVVPKATQTWIVGAGTVKHGLLGEPHMVAALHIELGATAFETDSGLRITLDDIGSD